MPRVHKRFKKKFMSIVIIGAGQAAIQTIMSLRQHGVKDHIIAIGDEKDPPYQRPPLSKKFMTGEIDKERLFFKPESYYSEQNVNLMRGTTVSAIDRNAMCVVLENGQSVAYKTLIIATGSRPRKLAIPGIDQDNVFDLRSIADVEKIMPLLQTGKNLIVIGGGYIGLETAASASQKGLHVTILEAAPRPLARVADQTISDFYTALHKRNGVNIITNAEIDKIQGDGTVSGVQMKNGDVHKADLIIMGVGIVPNIELAEAAGLNVGNGIIVDENGMTSDINIFAAGDCTYHPNKLLGRHIRLESVPNAIEQAKTIAAKIAGVPVPYHQIPWFWSDQFDVKLQIVGLTDGANTVLLRGNIDEANFARFHFKKEQLIAVEAINRPAEFMAGRQLVDAAARGLKVDKTILSDETQTPKSWLGIVQAFSPN